MRQLLLMAAIVLTAAPAAAQSGSDSIRIQIDADEMVFQNLEPVTGSEAAGIRREIDREYGNGDGTIQANEIQAYQDDNTVTFSGDHSECFDDFDLVRLDGQPPVRLVQVREEIIGALNTRADSSAPLQEVTILHFGYPRPHSDRVTVTVSLRDAGSLGAAGCAAGSPFGRSAPGQPLAPPIGVQGGAQQDAPDTIIRIHPLGQARIDRTTIRPDSVSALWDGLGIRGDTDQENALLYNNRITFTAEGGASAQSDIAATARDVGTVVGFATIGVASLGAIAALSVEFLRYKFLKFLLLVPGFSRLEKDEVLEHSKRDELYRFIKTAQGPSFSDLRRELGLSNGTLVHHLRILEAQEYVKAVRDGFRTRFYVRGPKIVATSYLTRTQQQLLEAIGSNPGLTQKELSLVLGLPRESVSYHTKQLAQKGQLEIRQDGKWRRYWPAAATASAASGPSTSTSP